MEKPQTSLLDLPSTVLENIYSYLSYLDVNRLRGTCKCIYITCGNYLKRGILDVKNELHHYMYDINNYFLTKRLPLEEKSVLLRAYNTLEILNLSLNNLVILNRHILERNDSCLPVGYVLNGFKEVINSMKRNIFGPWPSLGMNLHNRIRRFVENAEKIEPKLKTVIPLGVRAMDLIDTLMDARYEICAIYDIPNKFCYITGSYRLADSRFLSYLPDISFISDCTDRQITEEEADIIIKYLVLLVNVHNGLLTKSEQYRRDLEFSRKTILHTTDEVVYFDHWFESLKAPKKVSNTSRTPVYREVLDERGEVIEIYNRLDVGSAEVLDEGVKFLIQLKCSFEVAPIKIKSNIDDLMNDIILGNKYVECIDPKVLEGTCEISKNYGTAINLEIRLPYNNPQMIDLKFADGENVYVT